MSTTSGNERTGITQSLIVSLNAGLKDPHLLSTLGIKTEITWLCSIPDHQQGI
jgi:hypothetical protein